MALIETALRNAWILPLCLVLWLLRNRYRLSSVPGPLLNSISVLPRLWSVYRGSSHLDDLALHKKYGKIVRVAPGLVSVSDVSQLDQIYGISSQFYKSSFYDPVRLYDEEGILPDPFVLADKTLHARMKRNSANAYSLKALIQLEPLVDGVIARLFNHLDATYVETGKTCDIGEYMHFFSMDAIFTVTFGADLDFISQGDSKGFCKHVQDGIAYFACCGQVPWAHKFLLGNPYLSRFLAISGDSILDEILSIAVAQRQDAEKRILEAEHETAQATFLMTLLRNQAKSPSAINDREINAHAIGNIMAGGDTTSTALRAALRHLIDNPDVLARLLEELRQAGITPETPVSYAVASRVPYLTAVIRESMRLHPSVGMLLSRAVPDAGGLLSDGKRQYRVDAGIDVGINPWIIHRDPDIFPDPETYRPDRWLLSSPAQLAAMNRAWIPFGAGRHMCSGQHISLLEITKLIPAIVMRYHMQWEDADVSVTNHFFTIQSGMRVSLQRKKQE
ncbi:cytochrome P450 [Durotheca rogersii]|uniref:cytochrome P450 n=1 Tax=Durotheca rogersii TaxID=419775 RepID=UPI00221FE055|nr:cytochrome P450 [Durotheca rogersii]KAI5867540.1 cytochrome P450 [Durotheca rogersii]